MKCMALAAVALLALLPTVKAASQAKLVRPERAEVVFIDPDKFTDARDGYTGTDAGREAILNQLRDYMLEQAQIYIPPSEKLIVSVTDVDLAGDFEPWRGSQWDNVRIVKDIYPPRMNVDFRLVDGTGKLIKGGTRKLTNLAFMTELTVQFQDDPLRYEKTLLHDWFRSEFPRAKAN